MAGISACQVYEVVRAVAVVLAMAGHKRLLASRKRAGNER